MLAAGTLAGLALAEIAARLLHVAPEVGFIEEGRYRLAANPRIGYEMVPRLAVEGRRAGRYDFASRSNALGFRDREHAIPRSPGVFRILVLGDSIAVGLRIEDDREVFPAVLEERLRAGGVEAEVLNFGVSGYNTLQEVETLKEKGLAFHPDLVLVAYCLNDRTRIDGGIMRALREQEVSAAGRRLNAARLDPWLARSALYRFVRYRVLEPPRPAADDRLLDGDTVAQALGELGAMSRQEGFEVLVAVFPAFDVLDPYPYAAHHESVRQAAIAEGFDYVDLLPAFRRCALSSAEPLAFDSFHPTRSGHACAAGALEETIAALLAQGRPRARL